MNAITLNSHNAAILLKTTPTTRFDQTDPSVTYASDEQFQQNAILFSATGLAAGSHSLTIEVTGTRNGASTDTVVAVDAFDVTF